MDRSWDVVTLRVATACGALHVVHEDVLQPAPGVRHGQQLASVAVLVAVAGVAAVVVPRLWAAPQALVPALLGAVVVGDGGTHVVRLLDAGPTGVDLTGAIGALAGAVLLALAVRAAFRRRQPRRSRLGRWGDRVVTLVVAVAVGLVVVTPVVAGTVQVHLPRRAVTDPPSAEFTAVELRTADGLRLRAWYRPSRNGAAVLLLSTSRGDHGAVAGHARMLAERGYGVLVYDARGSGGSQGTPNGWGWTWLPDVRAGVDFLAEQPDVTRARIGLLGLSTGADVALEAAAVDHRVEVVVADGATAQGFADRPPGALGAVSLWPMYGVAELLTGTRPNPPLAEAIAAIAPRPVLLVACGSIAQEIPLNTRYAAAGGPSVQLWTLPGVSHTKALTSRPQDYADRVLGHLDAVLLAARPAA